MDANLSIHRGGVANVALELSRTNLLALLAKLDGNPPASNCTILKEFPGTGPVELVVRVKAVEDAAHYSDRPRGIMHEDTERAISGLRPV